MNSIVQTRVSIVHQDPSADSPERKEVTRSIDSELIPDLRDAQWAFDKARVAGTHNLHEVTPLFAESIH